MRGNTVELQSPEKKKKPVSELADIAQLAFEVLQNGKNKKRQLKS